MDISKVPYNITHWRKWHQLILEDHSLRNKSLRELAQKYRRSVTSIRRYQASAEYTRRFNEMTEKKIEAHINARELLEGQKIPLLKEKIRLALQSEKEAVRSECLSWLLELFPEFQKRFADNKQIVNVITPEIADKSEKTAFKLIEIIKFLDQNKQSERIGPIKSQEDTGTKE